MERWQAIEDLYHGARDLGEEDRLRFLDARCGSDREMRQQVEALLAQDDNGTSFLKHPAVDLVGDWRSGIGNMTTLTGLHVGVYEVLEPIGSGGMGEVYRARDTKLGRDVALKALPQLSALDADRLARFKREAHLLASLNHPNIAAIHGFEESDGVHALVLELVEGPTLADRIARRPIPLDEALPIARQIAEALEAAHEQGIIHRDLKPANVKVREDGTVKVLDFGLAKALERSDAGRLPGAAGSRDSANLPTITTPAMTLAGVILGTAAYMAPEQARGKTADKRADMWAFGCVLFEMLTGTRAFEGDDVSDTLANVLKTEPDWNALPSETPASVRRLLRRSLMKDPKRRIADASMARIEIDEVKSEPDIEGPRVQDVARRLHLAWAAALAVVTLIAAGALGWYLKRAPAPSRPLARFTIPLPMGDRFSNSGVHLVALSPDGTRLVYTANLRIYMRAMDQLEPIPIRGTEGDGTTAGRNPFFSPDGRWIGFWQAGQIKKVLVTGGAPVVLCAAENPFGASWMPDNTILYGQGQEGIGGIWRVSGDGGKPEPLVKVERGQIAQGPQMLPGGHAILFTLARFQDWESAQIVIQSLDTGVRRVVLDRGADARYVPTGHLVYILSSTLLAVPFDATTLAVTGSAVPVVEDVGQQNVMGHFAVSNQGVLAYVPRDVREGGLPSTLVWVDRQGREDPIKAAPPRAYFYPRLSPDGTRVALDVRQPDSDIWILDLARERLTRLTLGPQTFEQYSVWTPDGKAVIFGRSQLGGPRAPRSFFRQPSDGTGNAELLMEGDVAQFPSSVTPDGTTLIFRKETPPPKLGSRPGTDLLLMPLNGEHRPRPLLQTPFDELNAEVSPDGRWLAYQSNESGRHEIYVRPFPNVDGGKWQVSTNGGTQPVWARNGRELFYEAAGMLMRVPVTMGSAFEAGTASKLLDAQYLFVPPGGGLGRMYDVSPDGKRFLMIKASAGADERSSSDRIIIVQNWFEELEQRVPVK